MPGWTRGRRVEVLELTAVTAHAEGTANFTVAAIERMV
jgi:hypothetical protein